MGNETDVISGQQAVCEADVNKISRAVLVSQLIPVPLSTAKR
jgi:hypothetical protein